MARRSNSLFDFLNPLTAPMAIANSVSQALVPPGFYKPVYTKKPPSMLDKHYDAGRQIMARKRQRPVIRTLGTTTEQFYGNAGGLKFGPGAITVRRDEAMRFAEEEARRRISTAMSTLKNGGDQESRVLADYLERAMTPTHGMFAELVATDVETAASISAISKDLGAVSTEVAKARAIAEEVGLTVASTMKRLADIQIQALIDDIAEAPHVDAKQASVWTSKLLSAMDKNDWDTIASVNKEFRGKADSIIERIKASWMSSIAGLGLTVINDWDVVANSPNVILEAILVAVLSATLGRNDAAMLAKFIIPAMTWVGSRFVPQRLGLVFSGNAISVDRSTGLTSIAVRVGLRAKGSTLTSANATFKIVAVCVTNYSAGVTFVSEAYADNTTLASPGNLLGDVRQRDLADKDLYVTGFFPPGSLASGGTLPGDRVRVHIIVKPTADVAQYGEVAVSDVITVTARP